VENVKERKLNHYNQMRYLHILFTIMLFTIVGCGKSNEKKTEIVQSERGCIVDVSDKIVSIETDFVIGKAFLYIIDDILLTEEFYCNREAKMQ